MSNIFSSERIHCTLAFPFKRKKERPFYIQRGDVNRVIVVRGCAGDVNFLDEASCGKVCISLDFHLYACGHKYMKRLGLGKHQVTR